MSEFTTDRSFAYSLAWAYAKAGFRVTLMRVADDWCITFR